MAAAKTMTHDNVKVAGKVVGDVHEVLRKDLLDTIAAIKKQSDSKK